MKIIEDRKHKLIFSLRFKFGENEKVFIFTFLLTLEGYWEDHVKDKLLANLFKRVRIHFSDFF